LEPACSVGFGAAEGDLGGTVGEHVEDLAVGDVAHLVVVENGFAAGVAGHVLDSWLVVVVVVVGTVQVGGAH
jgi:hypothetical protein